MRDYDIEEVIRLCREFTCLAQLRLDELNNEDLVHLKYGSATSGALRRRSMDLTRALATMRKGARWTSPGH